MLQFRRLKFGYKMILCYNFANLIMMANNSQSFLINTLINMQHYAMLHNYVSLRYGLRY